MDRSNLGIVSKQVGIATRVWKLKHATGHCGVAERMHLRNQWPTDKCLECGAVETVEHVWTCPARDGKWDDIITSTRSHLSKDGTDRRITEAFTTTLAYLRNKENNRPKQPWMALLQRSRCGAWLGSFMRVRETVGRAACAPKGWP